MKIKFVSIIHQHFNIPFFKNAYSILGVQITSSILGFFYWAIAARLLSTEEIGLATALLSATMLVVGFSPLGFGDGIVFFLNKTKHPEKLINAYFTIPSIFCVIASLVFIVGQPTWTPDLYFLDSFKGLAIFSTSALILLLDALQNSLFIAERKAFLTLKKSFFINFLKLPMLLLFVRTLQWAFLLTAAVSTFIGIIIFMRQYFRHVRQNLRISLEINPMIWWPMIGYSIGNYLMNFIASIPTTVVPLIVLNQLGAEANGYFYIGWMISNTLSVLGRSFGVSLFVEGSLDQGSIYKNLTRGVRTSLIILLPMTFLLFTCVKPILSLFGNSYLEEATNLVRLLSLSAIPFTLYGIAIGVLKAMSKVKEMIIASIVFTALHLMSVYLFSIPYRLDGIGIGLLVARVVSLGFVMTLILPIFSTQYRNRIIVVNKTEQAKTSEQNQI